MIKQSSYTDSIGVHMVFRENLIFIDFTGLSIYYLALKKRGIVVVYTLLKKLIFNNRSALHCSRYWEQ